MAAVTHRGSREGGAEMWARVSWLSPLTCCWLSTRMRGCEMGPRSGGSWGARRSVLQGLEALRLAGGPLPTLPGARRARAGFSVLDVGVGGAGGAPFRLQLCCFTMGRVSVTSQLFCPQGGGVAVTHTQCLWAAPLHGSAPSHKPQV